MIVGIDLGITNLLIDTVKAAMAEWRLQKLEKLLDELDDETPDLAALARGADAWRLMR